MLKKMLVGGNLAQPKLDFLRVPEFKLLVKSGETNKFRINAGRPPFVIELRTKIEWMECHPDGTIEITPPDKLTSARTFLYTVCSAGNHCVGILNIEVVPRVEFGEKELVLRVREMKQFAEESNLSAEGTIRTLEEMLSAALEGAK